MQSAIQVAHVYRAPSATGCRIPARRGPSRAVPRRRAENGGGARRPGRVRCLLRFAQQATRVPRSHDPDQAVDPTLPWCRSCAVGLLRLSDAERRYPGRSSVPCRCRPGASAAAARVLGSAPRHTSTSRTARLALAQASTATAGFRSTSSSNRSSLTARRPSSSSGSPSASTREPGIIARRRRTARTAACASDRARRRSGGCRRGRARTEQFPPTSSFIVPCPLRQNHPCGGRRRSGRSCRLPLAPNPSSRGWIRCALCR